MDLLVCIPNNQEQHVLAEKLNPANLRLTHGYWTLPGHPRFLRDGDRIWFMSYWEVIASARVTRAHATFPKGQQLSPAVEFDVRSVLGHEFSPPRTLKSNFRGFRYVRRDRKHVSAARTTGLELVPARRAEALAPKSW